jgi:3-demethoxyubiquinol 3-hydroxylase
MEMSLVDHWICGAEAALRTLSGGSRADRAMPVPPLENAAPAELAADEKRLSGALMRVNHVGEVCAQALYQAQALATADEDLKAQMARAAREEIDHLAWTEQRLAELGDRPSLLNPLWYGGAFLIGLAAGRLGDRVSLGFVVETERQVEHHLEGHLERLPAGDLASRAIVDQMRIDEAEHAAAAKAAGGVELPAPVRGAMRLAAKVMTGTAHYV